MKTIVFIDTNILIDFLAKREEYLPAANVLSLAKEGKIDAYITNLTLANTMYILRKQLTTEAMMATMRSLCSFIHIAPSTEEETKFAFDTPNPDFEDALQYASAVAVKANYILTRNEKHFMYATIPVMDCRSYLDAVEI